MKKIQLSIAEPCQENWHAMTPTQQGRFCNACAKQVIDFTAMSDSEIIQYFTRAKNENVCGRTYTDQLDRTLVPSPKKKKYWYLQYAIAFFLFFCKTNKAKSQHRLGGLTTLVPRPRPDFILDALHQKNGPKQVVSGLVKDEAGQAIPFASVKLLNDVTGVSADEKGNFSLTISAADSMIEISALGYETKQLTVRDTWNKEVVLTKKMLELKEVVVKNEIGYHGKMYIAGGISVSACKTTKRNLLKDTLLNRAGVSNNSVKIFPDPVTRGSMFTVALTLKHTGMHTLRLRDASGKLLLQQQFNAVTKQSQESVQARPAWSAGTYYLQVIDEKGKQVAAAGLMIQ